MRYQTLMEKRYAEPFEPFRIHLSNGRFYDVRHPELLIVGRHTSHLGVAIEEEDFVLADRMIQIANDQITDTVPLEIVDQVDAGKTK